MPRLLILAISNHWGAQGHSPAAGVFVDRQIASLRNFGIRIIPFDAGTSHSLFHIFSRYLELRRRVRQERPDLVHAQYGTIVSVLGALTGCPLVISFCGNDLLTGASVSRLRMYMGFLMSNLAALRARKIICKSSELCEALWWRRERVVVIPNGVDLDMFSPGSREAARKQLGWEPNRPVVLFNVGSDPKRKGLDIAEAAMALVRTRLPDAELCVISRVQPLLMPSYYHAADVLLCASLREGSPNVVKEALACNLPVVSTPVGDVHERLTGVDPSTVVSRDANAIGDAVVEILLKRKRSNGRDQVAGLSLNNVARRILEVYRSACGLSSSMGTNGGVEEASSETGKEMRIVPIGDEKMIREVAEVHLAAFAGYLNVLLGRKYIQALVRWFARTETGIALAIVDRNRRVIGYALGAPAGYSSSLNRELAWTMVRSVFIRPWLFINMRFWNVICQRLSLLLGFNEVEDPNFNLPSPIMSLVGFGIAPAARRMGAGSKLMQEFCARAEKRNIRCLTLTVYRDRPEARLFYEKCGWLACDEPLEVRSNTVKYYRVLRQVHDVLRARSSPSLLRRSLENQFH